MNKNLQLDTHLITEYEKLFLLKCSRDALICFAGNKSYKIPEKAQKFPNLQLNAATFVTLEKCTELRGCMGMLEPVQTLINDVIENTRNSALNDKRFLPVELSEVEDIIIKISVLTPPEDIDVDSEEYLVQNLVPFHDGLIINEGSQKATFLPSVWEKVSDPLEFIQHLKQKAGFHKNYWSDGLHFQKYQTIEFCE